MRRFIVDSNLPYFVKQFNTSEFVSALELGITESDRLVWEYAKAYGCTIVTQDADFKVMLEQFGSPPKVIHFRTGNLSVRLFRRVLDKHWENAIKLSERHALVSVFEEFVVGAL